MKVYMIMKTGPLGIGGLQEIMTDRQAALEKAASSVNLRMEEHDVDESPPSVPAPVDRYWPVTYWRCGTCQSTVSDRTDHDRTCLP